VVPSGMAKVLVHGRTRGRTNAIALNRHQRIRPRMICRQLEGRVGLNLAARQSEPW